ncbi:unnamed protein product [Orchesella dallaii]|uniref:Uncharacterized protein n=1 Tax=Orchesella dallaii TaxID=48710 RepID=A0ABP1R016_9HEXA
MENNSVSDPDVLDYDGAEYEIDKIDKSSKNESPDDTNDCTDKNNDDEAAVSSSTQEQSATNQNDSSLAVAQPSGSTTRGIQASKPNEVTNAKGIGGSVYSRHDLFGTKSQTSSSTQAKLLEKCDATKEHSDAANCANNSINNLLLNFSAINRNIVQVYRAESYYYTAAGRSRFFRNPVMPILEPIRPLQTSTTQEQDEDEDYGGAPILDYYGPSPEPNPDFHM